MCRLPTCTYMEVENLGNGEGALLDAPPQAAIVYSISE
jgi:hypothetical protein